MELLEVPIAIANPKYDKTAKESAMELERGEAQSGTKTYSTISWACSDLTAGQWCRDANEWCRDAISKFRQKMNTFSQKACQGGSVPCEPLQY